VTYSIVAHDPHSGAYGVAVQSHWFNVGRSTAWVRFGAGVVATQALTDPSYGPRGLEIMAAGVDGPTALRVLLDADPNRDRRQVAILDHTGRVGVHTGSQCVPEAGHQLGDGWSVQGNLLANPDVVEAMAAAYPAAPGTLAERMVATLEAAENAGGDLRGSQSAAIRVIPGDAEAARGHEAGVDILVADHHDPIGELKRLVEVDRSYRALRRGGTALESGDETEARRQYALAAELRHGPEVDFWMAIGYFRMGDVDLAHSMLDDVFEREPSFRAVLERSSLADSDLVPLLRPGPEPKDPNRHRSFR
jgi:uncharacterized Ntn-hydrolase superfamily protein